MTSGDDLGRNALPANDNPAANDAPKRRPGADGPLRPLPKRFYKDVTVAREAELHAIALDGRLARTPRKNRLAVAEPLLAHDMAAEWRAQTTHINPRAMPLTTLVCTALDAVTGREADVAADIVKYFGTDLLCYRAEVPQTLAARQCAAWDPLIAWCGAEFGTTFATTVGLIHVDQPPDIAKAAAQALQDQSAFRLTGLHVLTTLLGSAILALAVARGRISMPDAWTAAHIDEDFQIEQWGQDDEANARRANRLAQATAAARILELVPA